MATNNDRSEIIDISGILRQYVSRWYWFVISVIACCALAFVYIKIHKPVYQINANLMIASSEDSGMGGELGAFAGLFGGKNSVDDEALILGSHSVMEAAAKAIGANCLHIERTGLFGLVKTNIYENYPLDIEAASPEVADTIGVNMRFKVTVSKDGLADVKVVAKRKTVCEVKDKSFPVLLETPYGPFTLVRTPAFREGEKLRMDILFSSYGRTAEDMKDFIVVDIVTKKANLIYLGYQTPYPEQGQLLLNELMRQYNLRGVSEENVKGEKTLTFVDDRLMKIGAEIDDIQNEYAALLNSKGIGTITGTLGLNYEMKGEVEGRIVEVQTQMEIQKMMLDFLSDPSNEYALVPGSLGSIGDNSIKAYNELVLKRIELERSAGEGNIALQTVTRQIDAMRSSILTTLRKNYESSQVRLRDLKTKEREVSGTLDSYPDLEGRILSMMREKETKVLVFKYLLQQREETAMKIANALSKGTVIDEAYVSNEPLGMSAKMILALALIAGLLIPPVLIYLNTLIRGRFETREDVERYTSVPILGEVCVSRSGETLVVRPGNNSSSESELFRLIRTNLQFMLRDPQDKVVLVTSTSSGEGKSFVSINLASSLSLLGKRTLLIGMDIRAGMLDRYLNLPPSRGLTEYLASAKVSLDDIIIREPLQPGLDIIVAGPVPPNPSELLAGERVDRMIAELRGRYDYIIIDSAPVGMVSDTFTLSRLSDATIYVCRAFYTPLRDLKFINSVHDQERLRRMGLVVNGTKARKGYGYGYGQRHGSGSRK